MGHAKVLDPEFVGEKANELGIDLPVTVTLESKT
jgi:hypothetical protein